MKNHIDVELVRAHPDAKLPQYGSSGAAAADLHAYLGTRPFLTIMPGETVNVSSGVKVSIGDPNYAMQLLPRSGLGRKGLILGNTVGLIDSDYQGEVVMVLHNRGREAITIENGDRVAQAIFLPVVHARFIEVASFSTETERGEGGFGSTGAR